MSVDEDDAVAVDDNSGAAAAVEEVVAVADDEVDEAPFRHWCPAAKKRRHISNAFISESDNNT